MSSTNRSRAREAHVSDYYVTPQSTIKEFLFAFRDDCPGLDPVSILDPCAGGDAKHGMAYPEAIRDYSGGSPEQILTVDCREDSLAQVKTDYLTWQPHIQFDMAITNPPFNIAMEVIKKALTDVKPGGLVIMLLRLNFFGSQERFPFWQNNMPHWTYVHSKRCRFLDTKGTDSIEYVHACFIAGENCKSTQLRVI